MNFEPYCIALHILSLASALFKYKTTRASSVLVGGPDRKDEFSDERYNYEQTEPTISGTAPLIGLFSKLSSGSSKVNKGSSHPKESPVPNPTTPEVRVTFVHSITDTWTVGQTTFYHHKVIIKNISKKPITRLRLSFENLSGSIWGLSQSTEKNTYELPQWLQELRPGSDCSFVYVQGGPQTKVSVISYN